MVILQEATRPDVVERLAEATGMPPAAPCPADRWRSSAACRLRSIAGCGRAGRSTRFSRSCLPGCDVRIFGVHLSAVHAAWTEARRVRELRSLLAAIARSRGVASCAGRRLQHAGARRAARSSPAAAAAALLVWLSGGRIRWQTIAIMLGAGYVDGYRHLPRARAGPDVSDLGSARAARLRLRAERAGVAARRRARSLPPRMRLREASDHFPFGRGARRVGECES